MSVDALGAGVPAFEVAQPPRIAATVLAMHTGTIDADAYAAKLRADNAAGR